MHLETMLPIPSLTATTRLSSIVVYNYMLNARHSKYSTFNPPRTPSLLVPPLFFWHPASHISAQRTDRCNYYDLRPKSLWYVPCSDSFSKA